MRTAHIVIWSLIFAAPQGVRAQDLSPAILEHDEAAGALVLKSSSPAGVYAIVAGLSTAHIPLPNGLVLSVSPELLLITGVLDDSGGALVPIMLESEALAGEEVHFQGGVWSNLPEDLLPNRLTNRLTTTFRSPITDRPPFDPNGGAEPVLRVLDLSDRFDPSVQLLSTDSIPPIYSVQVETKVQGLEAELVLQPLDHARGKSVVVLSAELVVLGPSEDSLAGEIRVLSVGRELGTELTEVEVRFTSRNAKTDAVGGR